GKWSDYQVSYTWMFDIEALHLACAFELKVPERCRGEVQQLISLINEQMWVGHFDLWIQDGLVMYRHALVLAGGVEASGREGGALPAAAAGAAAALSPPFQVGGGGGNAGGGGPRRRIVRPQGAGKTPPRPLASPAGLTRARFKTWMPTELGLARV